MAGIVSGTLAMAEGEPLTEFGNHFRFQKPFGEKNLGTLKNQNQTNCILLWSYLD